MALNEGDGFVELNGARLEYRWISPTAPNRPTLVFLHEGLGCVAIWKDFPQQTAAATGCGALVYSRAGYGRSSPITPPRSLRYLQEEGLTVLPALLAAFNLDDVVLIGHSDGGSIALIYAGSGAAAGLRGIAVMAPHVFNEALCVAGIRKAADAYRHGDLRSRLARLHGDNVDGAFWGWNQAWLDPAYLYWNIEEYLPAIRVPALVIQGRDDEYGGGAQYEAIRRQSGGSVSVLVLDNCGHAPYRDQRETALTAIAEFVNGL